MNNLNEEVVIKFMEAVEDTIYISKNEKEILKGLITEELLELTHYIAKKEYHRGFVDGLHADREEIKNKNK